MSRQAIAAVLARTDLASGERMVALSLASFAGRENRAWPGAPAASARAGLSRSRYQQAREHLIARGLLAVDGRVTGRGRASTVTLLFADTGPWWDGDVNVGLFEAVLTYSPVRGPGRLLLATMAALADERGSVCDLSTEQLCAAAGIADRTYRRARSALLASGRLELVSGAGGRGNTNVWIVRDPRQASDARVSRTPGQAADSIPHGAVWLQTGMDTDVERVAGLAKDHVITFVSCPVIGTRETAKKGRLVVLASGPGDALDRAQPIFDAIGSKTVRLEPEAGGVSRMKLVISAWTVGIMETLRAQLGRAARWPRSRTSAGRQR